MIFCERLRRLRQNSALMQKDIADMLDVSARTFSGWEAGRTEPSIEKIIKIAMIFGVSTDYLFGLSDKPFHANDVDNN